MNKLLLGASLMLGFSIAYAEIYTWTDSQGVVHFSDSPHQGSKPVRMPEAQSYSPVVPAVEEPSKDKEKQKKQKQQYTKIEITQPEDQATIRNNQGFLVVAVALEPNLFPGDKVQLIFDGAPIGEPQTNALFQLSGIYRGSHTVAAQVINAAGDALITSDPITVFMQNPRVGMGRTGGAGS